MADIKKYGEYFCVSEEIDLDELSEEMKARLIKSVKDWDKRRRKELAESVFQDAMDNE